MKIILLITILLTTSACYSTKPSLSCQDKGIQYFKDIGSYPMLSDGRNAAKVIRERCRRSPFAFGK